MSLPMRQKVLYRDLPIPHIVVSHLCISAMHPPHHASTLSSVFSAIPPHLPHWRFHTSQSLVLLIVIRRRTEPLLVVEVFCLVLLVLPQLFSLCQPAKLPSFCFQSSNFKVAILVAFQPALSPISNPKIPDIQQ